MLTEEVVTFPGEFTPEGQDIPLATAAEFAAAFKETEGMTTLNFFQSFKNSISYSNRSHSVCGYNDQSIRSIRTDTTRCDPEGCYGKGYTYYFAYVCLFSSSLLLSLLTFNSGVNSNYALPVHSRSPCETK